MPTPEDTFHEQFDQLDDGFQEKLQQMYDAPGEPPDPTLGGADREFDPPPQQQPPAEPERQPEPEADPSLPLAGGAPDFQQYTPQTEQPAAPAPQAAPPADQPPARTYTAQEYEQLQREHYQTQGMLRTLGAVMQQQQQKPQEPPPPPDPMAYFQGYKAPERQEGQDDPDYWTGTLAHAVGHAANNIREKEVAPLAQQLQQHQQVLQQFGQYISERQRAEAEGRFNSMLDTRLDTAQLAEGHPRAKDIRQYVTERSQDAFASGRANQWTEQHWGQYLDHLVGQAKSYFGPRPTGPQGTVDPNGNVIPRAPVGPSNQSSVPTRPARRTERKKAASVNEAWDNVNSDFMRDLDEHLKF